MAATPFEFSRIDANLVEVYNDAPTPTRRSPSNLPTGACNYVDLTPGANATRCGCRRFWTRQYLGSPVSDQAGWCMCNHHACYHENGDRDTAPPDVSNHPIGQENQRPLTGREPLSPVLDQPLNQTSPIPGLNFTNFGPGASLSFIHKHADANPGLGLSATPPPVSPMPDTMPWGDLIQSQTNYAALPPIPSQCLMPSQTASTASSVQGRYLRPFGGKGLQTLSTARGAQPVPPPPPPPPPPPLYPREQFHSRPATQQQRDHQHMDASFVLVGQDVTVTPGSGTATQAEPRAAMSEIVSSEAFKNLSDTVGGHSQRLDKLETMSFSAAGHDECHEKHDHMDLRMTDLETKLEEVERQAQDNGSTTANHDDRNYDATTLSVASFSTSATSRPVHSQEIWSQLQSLQAQVAQMQSSMPSLNHAWEVEVVFLPFPLKKIWQDIHQFKLDPVTSSDDWTQLPMTHSSATIRSQSPFHGDWTGPDHDAEWLLPKACGVNTITDKRLRSRGLIRKVSVNGPDARSVQLAVHGVFGDVFREMQMSARTADSNLRVSTYLGLQSNWVPLRKIHKDSRLRFLNASEMTTPALWNVQFLNSVMMRSSEPRLFITHPDAYLQDNQSYETGWTWQRLREMSRIYADSGTSQDVPEADALEEHWQWNELLDSPPGSQLAISSHHDRQRVSTSPSIAHPQDIQSWRSTSPVLARGESPALKGRRGPRPPHIRTASMPMSGAAIQSPASIRRRVVSNGQSRRSSPMVRPPSQMAITKRRYTRSPSHARFTPTWTKSPSPMLFSTHDRQPARGTTPFAYATPYSNAPLQEVRPVRSSSALRGEAEHLPPMEDDEYDGDFDIQIYESGSDESFDDGDSMASVEMVTHAQSNVHHESHNRQLPEDEPWPGIEDRTHISDGENVDPRQVGDQRSDASSQPSEYPSTQRAWPNDDVDNFHIHEDE